MILSKRNNLIDLLRFLAAISVVLSHFYYQVYSKINNFYTNFFSEYGKFGVSMFFVISGYCVMIALNHANKPTEFIIRRFFRIFPPYWFSLLLTIIVIVVLKLIRDVNSVAIVPKTMHDILMTFCLLTYPITNIKAINWVYWTLPYEIIFYIVIFVCSYLKNNRFTLLLIIITGLSCLFPASSFGFLSFFKFWPSFSLGMVVFKFLHEDKSKPTLNIVLFIITTIAFYHAQLPLPYVITCSLTAVLIVINHFKPMGNNKISRLGDISYSIYLIHVPLTVYCFGNYRNIPPLKGNSLLNPLLDTILIVMIIGLSKLMYLYIEIPSINLGKRLSQSLNKNSDRFKTHRY